MSKNVVSKYYPRLLIIDLTPVGHISATGQIKLTFLGDWSQKDYMQIWVSGKDDDIHTLEFGQSIVNSQSISYNVGYIVRKCLLFNPDIIYFRPVDSEVLFEVTSRILAKINKPLVIHMMDDWPKHLMLTDETRFVNLDASLRKLIEKSILRLSICKEMSIEYEERYGGKWFPLANGVELIDYPTKKWLPKTNSKTKPFIIRYMGGLADNMTFSSVKDIAKIVSSLKKNYNIRFEIYTMDWYLKKAKQEIGIISGVYIEKLVEDSWYNQLLTSADALVIAYNFDEISISYVGLSLANKMPECLASGTPLLAYGPAKVATINFLKNAKCSLVVDKRSNNELLNAIKKLVSDQNYCKDLSEKARSFAQQNLSKQDIQNSFYKYLMEASNIANNNVKPEFGPYYREQAAHIDETDIIAELFSETLSGSTMIDVEAHHGSALMPFVDMGWKVFAFEPDKKNRKNLIERLSHNKNAGKVNIDNRCISNKSQQGVSFYRSEESTGISGLSAFRESHIDVHKVDTITLAGFFGDSVIPKIDFLKIDTEGHDLFVLQGFPWNQDKPKVIECEFEDTKTVPLGYSYHDLAKFLMDKGYVVYVSEWHPVIRYGIRHDWKLLNQYPYNLSNPKGWGNLIAFRDGIKSEDIIKAIEKTIKFSGIKVYDKQRNKPDFPEFAGIIMLGEVIHTNTSYRLSIPDANNWVACKYQGNIKVDDHISCKVLIKLNEACELKLMLCRDGGTSFESTSKIFKLEGGNHKLDISHEFNHNHNGLRIQINAIKDEFTIESIESKIKISRGNKTAKTSSIQKNKYIAKLIRLVHKFLEYMNIYINKYIFPKDTMRRQYAKKIKYSFQKMLNINK